MKKILVTDSLWIFPEHEAKLRNAGFEVERLDKPEATEAELIEAVNGKAGYILGGIEKVTGKVIDAGTELQAIVFAGSGYQGYIPAWRYALQKNIKIANVPDGPTQAVAEWSMAAALAMTRGLFTLDRTGSTTFMTTNGIEGQSIGIVGLGNIAKRISEMLKPFRPKQILYTSRHRYEELEAGLSLNYRADLHSLLELSDIVFLCVSDDAGQNFFGDKEFAAMKNGALLVSFMHEGIINADALYAALKNGKINAISDIPMDKRFDAFPLSRWYSFKTINAFNTRNELQYTSDMATETIINLLTKGTDKNSIKAY